MTFEVNPQVTEVDSGVDGPHVVIMSGVHGNERVGLLAFEQLKSKLTLQRGRVSFVVANPTAIAANTRYLNVNLNRRFGKNLQVHPEDALARNIEKILDTADALLDIHSYNEEMDRPFIITNGDGVKLARQLPVGYVTYGWEQFDAGSSESYMTSRGKTGMVFECGSSYRSEAYVELAIDTTQQFLGALGMHATKPLEQTRQRIIEVYELVQKQYPAMEFSGTFTTFDELESNKQFAQNGKNIFVASDNDVILFPRPKARLGDEIFIRGRLIAS